MSCGDPALEYSSDLHVAVQAGDSKGVRQLLNKGALVNAKDGIGRTPLHWAVVFEGEDIAKMLLVNTPRRALQTADKYGRTALHYAAGLGRLQLAKVMLDRGANVNISDKRGLSPLHVAAEHVEADMVELLLSKGADKYGRDGRGWLPVDYARRQGSHTSVELLTVKESASKVYPMAEVEVAARPIAGCMSVSRNAAKFEHRDVGASVLVSSPTREEMAKKHAALEDLLSAWKGAESTVQIKTTEKCPRFMAVETALEEWRAAEQVTKARMVQDMPAQGDTLLSQSGAVMAAAPGPGFEGLQAGLSKGENGGGAARVQETDEDTRFGVWSVGRVGMKRHGEQELEGGWVGTNAADGSDVREGSLWLPTKKHKEEALPQSFAAGAALSEDLLTWEHLQSMVGSFSGLGVSNDAIQGISGLSSWKSLPGLTLSGHQSIGGAVVPSSASCSASGERFQETSLQLIAMAVEAVAAHAFEEDSWWCTEWDAGVKDNGGDKLAQQKLEEWTRHVHQKQRELSMWTASESPLPSLHLPGTAISAN